MDEKMIDKLNIFHATYWGTHRALDNLDVIPEHILMDGNAFKPYNRNGEYISHTCVVKGDDKYASIAAASILAKTYRDDLMKKLHLEHPQYQWKNNKGYPTKSHRAAIKRIGVSQYHRKSFRLLPEQLSLNI